MLIQISFYSPNFLPLFIPWSLLSLSILTIIYLWKKLKFFRESSDRMKRTLSGIQDGHFEILIKEEKIKDIFFDKYCYRILGLEKPETDNLDFFRSYIDDLTFIEFKEEIEARIEKQRPIDSILPISDVSGKIHWIRIRGGSFQKAENLQILGTCTDITEEEALKEQLQRDREDFLMLHRIAGITRWEYNWKEETLKLVRNVDVIRFYTDLKPWDFFKDRDRFYIKGLLLDSIKAGQPFEEILQLETDFKGDPCSDWVRISGSPSDRNPDLYIGITENVTSLIESKEKADVQNRLFQALVDNIPFGIFVKEIKEGKHRYVLWNRRVSELHHMENKSIKGKTDWEIYPEHIARKFVEEDLMAIEKKEMMDFGETTDEYNPGKLVNYYKIPLMNHKNEAVYLIGIIEDITEKKNLEKQLFQSQKLDAIGKLAGGIAHDFNNLMAGIMGITELLLTTEENPKTIEYLNNTLKLTRRAADLTEQLLTFSRKGEIRRKPVEIHKIIDESLMILKRTIDKNIQINTGFTQEKSVIEGNPNSLINIFLNLGINARDAMPEGGLLTVESHRVTLSEEEKESLHLTYPVNRWIKINVKDTGEGIEKETIEKIFEPFFTTKKLGKGTGLGLSAVYGSTLKHNGNILVESTLGEGTVFTLYFPLIIERED